MNAREKAHVRRLELENDELRAKVARHIDVYRDQSLELIEMRAKLELLREIMEGDAND